MRIEELGGKAASRQASLSGFETEDVLYLLPLVTLCNGTAAVSAGGGHRRAAVRAVGDI